MNLRRIALNIVISTDRSLAESIREEFLSQFLSIFPTGYFDDKLYDTGEGGKGYRPGYVSFGLKPTIWYDKGLIGGILISGTYPSKTIYSESPEPDTTEWKEWEKAGGSSTLEGGEIGVISLQAAYYNKKEGGESSRKQNLGKATFIIDNLEHIEEIEIDSVNIVKSGIEFLVDDVLRNPPDNAISKSKKVQRQQTPYSSIRKFVDYLSSEGRNTFRKNEISEVSKYTGKPILEIKEWLRKRGFSLENSKFSSA